MQLFFWGGGVGGGGVSYQKWKIERLTERQCQNCFDNFVLKGAPRSESKTKIFFKEINLENIAAVKIHNDDMV